MCVLFSLFFIYLTNKMAQSLGAHKPGSTRKMIGSPRQLETAVPTSKNPHGVWV